MIDTIRRFRMRRLLRRLQRRSHLDDEEFERLHPRGKGGKFSDKNSEPSGIVGSDEKDKEYLSAVHSGNKSEIKRLFNKVAESSMRDSRIRDDTGKLIPLYHGTGKNFTEFKRGNLIGWLGKGIYFAGNRSYAKENGRKVISVYLDSKKPFIVNGNNHYDVLKEVREKFPEADEYNLSEVLQENGFDSILYKDWDKGLIVSVFNPEQIKSADSITYDDNGNVIPLSKRFDPNNNDIRY